MHATTDAAPIPGMGTRAAAERAVRRASGLFASHSTVLIVCLLLVGVLGYLDYLTGYEQSLLLFYLVPISLATWFWSLGFGLIISLISVLAWVTSDLCAGIPTVGVWNLVMASAAYAVFSFLLAQLRTVLGDLENRVRERTKALRHEIAERERLDRELADVADRERRRLGQDLHDSICQHLTGTALTAQTLREKLAARSASEVAEADKVVRYIEEGIDLSRNLARGLVMPELEPEGLMIALQELAENMTARFHVPCRFEAKGVIGVRDGVVATQLYRVAQEAVTNAMKHADAKRVRINLVESETSVTLAVSDDGIGFPRRLPQSGGLGLRLMAHSAALAGGDFQVSRNSDGGTTVTCKVNVATEEE